MPRLFLTSRNTDLIEIMDDPDCDERGLHRTYDWFSRLNPWLARWRSLYNSHLSPLMAPDRTTTILDIGCGGGDLLRLIDDMSRAENKSVSLTGIDPDKRAIDYALARTESDRISYHAIHSSELVDQGLSFDIVVSNHVLHHLDDPALNVLLEDSATLSRSLALHNDICRDDLAWLSFIPVGLAARGSFIMTDGLRSIRRSWHPDDLDGRLPAGWRAEKKMPFRLLLTHRGSS